MKQYKLTSWLMSMMFSAVALFGVIEAKAATKEDVLLELEKGPVGAYMLAAGFEAKWQGSISSEQGDKMLAAVEQVNIAVTTDREAPLAEYPLTEWLTTLTFLKEFFVDGMGCYSTAYYAPNVSVMAAPTIPFWAFNVGYCSASTVTFADGGFTEGQLFQYGDPRPITGGPMANFLYDTATNLPASVYAVVGYTQTGWTNKVPGGLQYALGAPITTDLGDVTLSATWRPNTYTVACLDPRNYAVIYTFGATYDITLGSNPLWLNVQTAYYNAGVTVQQMNEITGFTNTIGGTLMLGAVYNLTSVDNETLYYYPTVIEQYRVDFDGNGATSWMGSTYNQVIPYDTWKNLTLCQFTAPVGYTFAGWTNSAGVHFSDEESVNNLAGPYQQMGTTITLYATWAPITYNVIFYNGYSLPPLTSRTYGVVYTTPNAIDIYFMPFLPEGYTPSGWTNATGAYADGAAYSNLTTVAGNGVGFWPVLIPVTGIPVTFTVDSATYATTNVTAFGTAYADYFPDAPTKAGYTFDYWMYNGADVSLANVTTEFAHELVAHWTPIKYSVLFEGGKMPGSTAYNYDQVGYAPVAATVATHMFAPPGYAMPASGWTNSAGTYYADGVVFSNLTTEAGALVVMSPVFPPLYYMVNFDDNGATGGAMMYPQGIEAYVPTALRANTFEKYGYEFMGWTNLVDGGAMLLDEAEVTFAPVSGSVALTAVWSDDLLPDYYVVTFVTSSSTPYTQSIIVRYGDPMSTITLPTISGMRMPVCIGYTNAFGKMYYDGATPTRNWDQHKGDTLYSVWFSTWGGDIAFYGNGGMPELGVGNFNSTIDGSFLIAPFTPTREGHVFIDWNTEPDGTGDAWDDGDPQSKYGYRPSDLYAQWHEIQPDEYIVTLSPNGTSVIDGYTKQVLVKYGEPMPPIVAPEYSFGSMMNTFLGYTNAVGTLYYDINGMGEPTWDQHTGDTLYAVFFSPMSSSIFYGNGGTPWVQRTTIAAGSLVQLPDEPTRENYSFASWNTDPDGNGTEVTSASGFFTTPRYIYAQWEPDNDGGDDEWVFITDIAIVGDDVTLTWDSTQIKMTAGTYTYEIWTTTDLANVPFAPAYTEVATDFTVLNRASASPSVKLDNEAQTDTAKFFKVKAVKEASYVGSDFEIKVSHPALRVNGGMAQVMVSGPPPNNFNANDYITILNPNPGAVTLTFEPSTTTPEGSISATTGQGTVTAPGGPGVDPWFTVTITSLPNNTVETIQFAIGAWGE